MKNAFEFQPSIFVVDDELEIAKMLTVVLQMNLNNLVSFTIQKLHSNRPGRTIHILISDNGAGIPDKFASWLFEPYVTSKDSGTGLGLWLSNRVIAKHSGTLRFCSSQRKGRTGTSFRISLPSIETSVKEGAVN